MLSPKKILFTMFFFISSLIGLILFFQSSLENVQSPTRLLKKAIPSLQVFPLDQSIEFSQVNSTFTFEKERGNSYFIQLKTSSLTTTPTYLRQDVALIYSNGILLDKVYEWEENVSSLEYTMTMEGEGSTRYDVITFHHAEIHHHDRYITSQYAMSSDQVYILTSAFSAPTLFREAHTNTQKQWQRILDRAINDQWRLQKNHLFQFFRVDQKQYDLIPLTELHMYQHHSFPYFSEEETKKIIGGVWEGIYRHYILGITNPPDEPIDTKGSTVPILLLAKDKSHLKILFRTAQGKEIQLIQTINP